MATEIYVDLPDHRRHWIAEGLDDRREAVDGLHMPWSKSVQIVHPVEADTVEVYDRGGVQQTLAVTVTRLFDTKAQARRYVFTHAELHGRLPGKLTVVQTDEDGRDVWELIGHITGGGPRQIGVTVITSYEIVGARWQRPATY